MTENLKVEGWQALAEVLGIMKTMQDSASVPSVELTMDSKGVVKPTVKVYAHDPQVAKTECVAIFDELRARFGLI